MGKRDWSGVSSGPSNDLLPLCSTLPCKGHGHRDFRTIPVPPQSSSRPVSPSITVSLDRLLDALEFDPDWTPSTEIIPDFGGYREEIVQEVHTIPDMDPACLECCAALETMREPSEPALSAILGDDNYCGEKRKKIVLGPDGEPDIISDIDSDDDFDCCGPERITANVSPPVVLPKKELIYFINVIGEDGMLEIDRIDDQHPLPNCRMRDMGTGSQSFFPPFYVQGVCSEMLDTNLTGPRWLGEEFDKTEEQREAERIQRERDEAVDNMEYEF